MTTTSSFPSADVPIGEGSGTSGGLPPQPDSTRGFYLEATGWAIGALALATAVVLLISTDLILAVVLLVGIGILAGVMIRPIIASYVFLFLSPLLAGFERGAVLPVARPGEALLLVMVAALVLREIVRGLQGRMGRYEITMLDITIGVMAVFASFVPLLWQVGRGQIPELDDYLYSTVLWKYLLVFAMFRAIVKTEAHIVRSLYVMMSTGMIVGLIAILQAVNVFGVPEIISAIYGEPLQAVANNRGSATLGTSHGVADIMSFNLVVCLAFLRQGIGNRTFLLLLAPFFAFATLASGQFSAFGGLVVAVIMAGYFRRVMAKAIGASVPSGALMLLVMKPVVEARFANTSDNGLPSSWEARQYNLSVYFIPRLKSGLNWLFGVRPAARLPSFEPWREFVFIESGHIWLLWTGGVPLVAAFMWFSWVIFRTAMSLARRPGLAGAMGDIVATVYLIVFVLMTLDVHLTMRGPADALFPLMAMLCTPILWVGAEELRKARLDPAPLARFLP